MFSLRAALHCSSHSRSVPTPAYQWPASPILPPISSRTPHLVPDTLVPMTNSSSSLNANTGDFGFPRPTGGGASWIALNESQSGGGEVSAITTTTTTTNGLSQNDWRMVRMYELMEDFEDVLARAPISLEQQLQQPISSMGGKSDGSSRVDGRAERGGEERVEGWPATLRPRNSQHVAVSGNCLTGGCCYNSSSTESETMQRGPSDQSKSTSKYKKQRERLLSRPTL